MDGWSWIAAAALAVAVVVVGWGLFSPAQRLPGWTHRHDKLWHALAFAGLAGLVQGIWPAVSAALVWLLVTALGVVTEVLQQRYAPGRSFSWGDALANALGASVGVAAAAWLWPALRAATA